MRCAAAKQNAVAIGFGPRHRSSSNHPARAATVFDDHIGKNIAELFSEGAGHGVIHAAGREGDDEFDRLGWIGLSLR